MAKITVGDFTIEGTVQELVEFTKLTAQPTKPKEIEVGDKVIIKHVGVCLGGFHVGEEVTVVQLDEDETAVLPYKVRNMHKMGWAKADEVELAGVQV